MVFDAGVGAVAAVEAGGDLVWMLAGLRWGAVGGEGFVAPAGRLLLQVEGELSGAGQGFRGGLPDGFDAAGEYLVCGRPGGEVGQQGGDVGDLVLHVTQDEDEGVTDDEYGPAGVWWSR